MIIQPLSSKCIIISILKYLLQGRNTCWTTAFRFKLANEHDTRVFISRRKRTRKWTSFTNTNPR